jgi:hypothetical protein
MSSDTPNTEPARESFLFSYKDINEALVLCNETGTPIIVKGNKSISVSGLFSIYVDRKDGQAIKGRPFSWYLRQIFPQYYASHFPKTIKIDSAIGVYSDLLHLMSHGADKLELWRSGSNSFPQSWPWSEFICYLEYVDKDCDIPHFVIKFSILNENGGVAYLITGNHSLVAASPDLINEKAKHLEDGHVDVVLALIPFSINWEAAQLLGFDGGEVKIILTI